MPQATAFQFGGVKNRTTVEATPSRGASHVYFALDDQDPLVEVLHAAVSDFGGDGVLAIWRPAVGDTRVLYASDACRAGSRVFADLTAAAQAPSEDREAPRLHWRTLQLRDNPEALQAAFPVTNGTIYLAISSVRAANARQLPASEKVARIFSFMHPFFRSWSAQLVLETSLEAHAAAINGSGVGMVLVDRDGHVLSANVAANQLFDAGDGIRRKGRMIYGCTLADTMKLSAAIDHVVTPADKPDPSPSRVVLRFDRATGHPLLVTIVTAEVSADREGAAAAIIYVVDPDRDIRPMVGPICELYGMSQVEIRLACELAMGRSIVEAARAIRVRETTARSYLKQVFIKTDTHRQAELVRLLTGGAVGVETRTG